MTQLQQPKTPLSPPGPRAAKKRGTSWQAAHWLDRMLFPLFIASIALVSFVGGAWVAEFDVRLYTRWLKPCFVGLRAVQAQRQTDWSAEGWYPARDGKTGVATYRADRAFQGLTLYSSLGDPCSASLISMSGDVVHRWSLPFEKAWPAPPHVKRAVPLDQIYWHGLHLFPNGDLLASYTGLGDTPYGYGLAKMDKDSRPIWTLSQCVHHVFDVDGDGRIYALTQAIRREPFEAAPHLKTPMLEDFVVVLSPDGKELRRVAILDAFASSPFGHVLESIKSEGKGDHTHTNSVHVIPPAFAEKHKFCSPGDVLISVRNPSTLAILNLQRQQIVWAARGFWREQHDADPLENGNVLMFDNKGRYGRGGRSRVIEFDPAAARIDWSYAGTKQQPFESLVRGDQQLLPNGNVLITESNNGRIVEVTHDQEIVWEFFSPLRRGEKGEMVALICNALRFHSNQLCFLTIGQLEQAARGAKPQSHLPDSQATQRDASGTP